METFVVTAVIKIADLKDKSNSKVKWLHKMPRCKGRPQNGQFKLSTKLIKPSYPKRNSPTVHKENFCSFFFNPKGD